MINPPRRQNSPATRSKVSAAVKSSPALAPGKPTDVKPSGFARFFSNVGLVAGCLWIVIGLSFLLTAGTNWHATILTEAAMQGIALARPSDMGELLEVKGIGPKKAEQYGEAILQIVRLLAPLYR